MIIIIIIIMIMTNDILCFSHSHQNIFSHHCDVGRRDMLGSRIICWFQNSNDTWILESFDGISMILKYFSSVRKKEIKDCLDTSEYFKRHHFYIKPSFFSSSFESLEPNRRYLKTALDFVFNPFVGTFQ